MTYEEIFEQVAGKLGLPVKVVERAYKAYWRVVKDYIASQPLKEDLTDEEFLALRPHVNIPKLGKFCVTLDRYRRVKKYHEIVEMKIKKRQEKQDASHQEG